MARVVTHSAEPASRLIWIYAVSIGAFQGVNSILALFLAVRYGVTATTIGYFFMYVGVISVVTRAVFLGKLVDWLGEAQALARRARAHGGGARTAAADVASTGSSRSPWRSCRSARRSPFRA